MSSFSTYSKSAGPIRNIWGKKWSIISFFIVLATGIFIAVSSNKSKTGKDMEQSSIDSSVVEQKDSIPVEN